MLNRLFSAYFLLPLLLASPMVVLGPYGLSLAEIMVVMAGVLLWAQSPYSAPIPKVLLFYTCCFAIGWLTALSNAGNWGIVVGAERLSFLYLVGLPVLAYVVGRRSRWQLEEIVTSRYATAIMCIVGISAAAWPVLANEMRAAVFTYFWADIDAPRFRTVRFPGIGVNANVYSFVVLFFLVFSFHAYLKGKTSFLFSFAAFVVIFACASRLVVAMSILSCAALWWSKHRADRRSGAPRRRRTPLTLRRREVFAALMIGAVLTVAIRYSDELQELRQWYIFVLRFEDAFVGEDPLEQRQHHWRLGMERVKLAPVRGISMPGPEQQDDAAPLLFAYPHNEYIYIWSAYGLFGLIAHIGLIGYLVVLNLRRKSEPPWIIVYLALSVQMVFDGAFASPRFLALFFIVVGLNVLYLQSRRDASSGATAAIPRVASASGPA